MRADRDKRSDGGALLYIHSSLTYENVSTYNDHTCEAVICTLGSIDTVISCVYRPPDASDFQTKHVLSFLSSYLSSTEEESYKDQMLADNFNLPNIDWETVSVLHGAENSASATL